MNLKVFVYGTLKPGESHYHLCAEEVVAATPAIVLGQLYHLPLGYPALVPDGQQLVHGFVLTLKKTKILQQLDDYEQHDPATFARYAPGQALEQNQYHRQELETFNLDQSLLGTAWAYVMTQKQVQCLRGISIPEGNWSRQQFERMPSVF